MKKLLALVLSILMLMSLFTACGAAETPDAPDPTAAPADAPTEAVTDSAYIKEKGVLVVGITDYEPMDYKDENGNWTGFDAEFAQLFAEELDVDCEFYVIADWGKKFMELDTKMIDVVWNGMTINEEATSNSSVSDPYVLNAQVVVMKADAVANYGSTEAMKGLTIAVENGSAGQTAAEAIPDANIIPLQDQGSALLEVKAGTADVCIIDITMAYAMTGEGTDYADLAPGISLTEEYYGVSFRKGSDLTAMLNDLMAKLRADGSLQALADKYGLTLAQ